MAKRPPVGFDNSTYYLTGIGADARAGGIVFHFENDAGEELVGLVPLDQSLRLEMKIARLTGEAKGENLKKKQRGHGR